MESNQKQPETRWDVSDGRKKEANHRKSVFILFSPKCASQPAQQNGKNVSQQWTSDWVRSQSNLELSKQLEFDRKKPRKDRATRSTSKYEHNSTQILQWLLTMRKQDETQGSKRKWKLESLKHWAEGFKSWQIRRTWQVPQSLQNPSRFPLNPLKSPILEIRTDNAQGLNFVLLN